MINDSYRQMPWLRTGLVAGLLAATSWCRAAEPTDPPAKDTPSATAKATPPATAKATPATAAQPKPAAKATPSGVGKAASTSKSPAKTTPKTTPKPKPAPKPKVPEPNPRSGPPVLAYVFPAGGQQATTVTATLSGSNLRSLESIRITGRAVTARVTEEISSTEVRIAIAIAGDAPLGERDLRAIGPGGFSNRFRFFVGELPEVRENEPNSEPVQAQPLASLPATVNGQILSGDRDYYRFSAKAGQTLVLDVFARRILPYIPDAVPAWLEACLILYDAQGRKVAYADDFRFRQDPLLIFRVPRDGEYLLEVRDLLFRGRGDFIYRMNIGELPYLTHVFPLGCRRNSTAPLTLRGVNLPAETLQMTPPSDGPSPQWVQVRRGKWTSNRLPLAVDDLPETLDGASNNGASNNGVSNNGASDNGVSNNGVSNNGASNNGASNNGSPTPQKIDVPVIVNGRIDKPGASRRYRFRSRRGQRLVMEVRARRLDSPLDSLLTLFDASTGRKVAENDDTEDLRFPLNTHHADSRLLYTFSNDGDYVLQIADTQGRGGEEYAYRLSIAPPLPDFSLRVSPDNLRVGRGDSAMLTITATRIDGFAGEIEIVAPDLPKGFVASEAVVSTGQNQTRLTISAPVDAKVGILVPTLQGTATIDGRMVTRKAEAAETIMQAFTWSHVIPTQEYSVAVLDTTAPPFRLAVTLPASGVLEIPQDGEIQLPVKVTRLGDTKGQVSITAPGAPFGVTVKPGLIGELETEGTISISAGRQARAGAKQNLIFAASMRSGRQSISQVVPAIPIRVIEAKPAPPAAPSTPAAKEKK